MKTDEGLQWIRDVRIAISNKLGNDPHRFAEYYRNWRSKYRRLSKPSQPRRTPRAAKAAAKA